jgi:predicted ArsR family transcriptional regulator
MMVWNVLEVRTRHQIDNYENEISNQKSLKKKLETLANIRTDEGYMAEVEALEDGSFLLIENHCPICTAAQTCTGLCVRELEVFQTVLGKDVAIERSEHILTNSRRCVYRVLG